MFARSFILFFVYGFLLASTTANSAEPLKVVTTSFPLYDFAREIGRDKVDISMLLPPGVEAHTFEPKAKDIVRLNKADIFLYTGQFMEPWAADILNGVTNKTLTAVDSSQGITLMDADEDDHGAKAFELVGAKEHFLKNSKGVNIEPKEQEPKQAHHHHEGGKDPHIWLDFELAQQMVDTIARAFATKDTTNSAFYLANAQSYKSKLQALDERYKETLSSCEIKTIIYAGHFAFGYFAKRYNLTHVSPYKGFSPDAQPTAKRIKEIIDTINNVGSNTIYYEELIDPKVARMISDETGAKLELLHGAHNVSRDEMNKTSYLKIMDDNLPKLKDGLRCK